MGSSEGKGELLSESWRIIWIREKDLHITVGRCSTWVRKFVWERNSGKGTGVGSQAVFFFFARIALLLKGLEIVHYSAFSFFRGGFFVMPHALLKSLVPFSRVFFPLWTADEYWGGVGFPTPRTERKRDLSEWVFIFAFFLTFHAGFNTAFLFSYHILKLQVARVLRRTRFHGCRIDGVGIRVGVRTDSRDT